MRAGPLALVALGLVLSGCLAQEGDGAGEGADGDQDGTPQQNATQPVANHFEFGETAGCAGDAHSLEPTFPLNCVSFQGGPDATGIDGHWLPLGPAYEGLTLTTTMEVPGGANADSDCVFLAADLAELGNGNNGQGPCTGLVPPGTAWLFLYPWATPATSMTADFTA